MQPSRRTLALALPLTLTLILTLTLPLTSTLTPLTDNPDPPSPSPPPLARPPVDAPSQAILRIIGRPIELKQYNVTKIHGGLGGPGSDALLAPVSLQPRSGEIRRGPPR